MRFVVLKFAYPHYLRQFYERDPALAARSYADQKAALDHDSFWWGDSLTHALRPLGYDVAELIMNAEPMQRAWARENGVEARGATLLSSVLKHQLRKLRAEVLFIQGFGGLTYGSLRALRESCPSLRAVLGWCASRGASGDRALELCDAVVSCAPELAAELNAAGHRCFHMNHAFDPRVLDRIDERPSEVLDFSFLGNVLDEPHCERLRMLRTIGKETELHVFTEMRPDPVVVKAGRILAAKALHSTARALLAAGVQRTTLHGLPFVGRASAWRHPPRFLRNPVPKANHHEAAYGLRMFETLRRSRVTLNVHTALSPRSACNLRLFEATGVGACLLTDWRENLGGLFEVDREVVAYRSPGEAVDKVRWLLDHPADRDEIARSARRRVLRDHTFEQRAPILDSIIKRAT